MTSFYQNGPGFGQPSQRRRGHPVLVGFLIFVGVMLSLGDWGATLLAEHVTAGTIQKEMYLSGDPSVHIGQYFWAELAERDFSTVTVTANNVTINPPGVPPGQLQLAGLWVTLHGVHIHSFSSATVDHVSAEALVTFPALAKAGGVPPGITLSTDGPNQIKASVDLGILKGSAYLGVVWTKASPNQVTVRLLSVNGIPTQLLGKLGNFTVPLPALPDGLMITGLAVTQQGLLLFATGTHDTFSP